MTTLINKLIDKTCNYRDVAPVFRIEQRSVDDLEAGALRVAGRVVANGDDVKSQITRGKGRSDILLPEGARAGVFHASGAIAVKASLAPMEHLIEKADKESLAKSTVEVARKLGFDQLVARDEQLLFERLWQIKAAGMSSQGVRGREVVCRAVGAFRRYLHGLPVWGRASAFVEIAAGNRIGSIGVDWRAAAAEPFDRVKVMSPEQAARAVLNDLNGRLPGGSFEASDFEVGLFGLGYFSFPKRREQSVFAPVYVAMLERRGWTSMNYVSVVSGSETTYESLCRNAPSPPRDASKPQPGTKHDSPPGTSGWDPFVKRKC
jgi:hypothetical protein